MANIKVSEMTQAENVNNNDWLMIVQNATNKKVTKQVLMSDLSSRIDGIETEQTTQNENIQSNSDNIETLQTEVTELQEDVQNLRNASYKVSGSGTNFSLNNTTKNKFIEFLPGGNTEQTQYEGKNLLDLSKCTLRFGTLNNDNSITSDINDGYYTQINTNSLNSYLLSHKGQSITFSIDKVLENKLISIVIYGQRENSTYQDVSVSNSRTVTLTIANDFTSITGLELRINRSNTKFTDTTTTVSQLMVEEGTTATDYEPYCGGIPSPNTDYPQQIYKVVGNVTNKIENKNLLPFKNQDFTIKGINFKITNGKFIINGTATGEISSASTEFKENFSFMLSPGTYYFKKTSGINGYLRRYDDNVVIQQGQSSFTVTEKVKAYYGIYIANETSKSNVVNADQVEVGSAFTDYEEHQEQILILTLGTIELCKLDTAKDYFFKNSGKWYLHKEIGKTILNGTEVWYGGVYGSYYRCYTSITGAKTYPNLASSIALSNYFNKNINVFVSDNIKKGMFGQYSNTTNFYFGTDEISVADFKTWLSTHNTEVYYVLATPTDTEITDETLISQLEIIKKAMSYNNQTNISSESDEVGMIIDATAVGDINKVISNIDSRVSLLE